ncbi:hypothetical protein GGR56DRAFT_1530 [Xylariaceae sp. FL0804]|nr:hypothetical protein GGR56DRAFT_1530 [Xylariaceae sp. FL0804]
MASSKSQVVYAPSEEPSRGVKSIFLAGSTSMRNETDWREVLSSSLSALPITIYNPARSDWDSSWREEFDFAPYREQVLWELDKQAVADVVVVYFHPATQAVISLLELGLSARLAGKVIAVCPRGYWKRGNVQIVCHKYGIEMLDDIDELPGAVEKKLAIGS